MSKNNILVISLPRTGTTSMTGMLKILGYNSLHAAPFMVVDEIEKTNFYGFSDTPVYSPLFFTNYLNRDDIKFIYLERNKNDWVKSFEEKGFKRQFERKCKDITKNLDNINFSSLLFSFMSFNISDGFDNHRKICENVIPKDKLLFYSFDMGWEPLCDFLKCQIPEEKIPHLNKK